VRVVIPPYNGVEHLDQAIVGVLFARTLLPYEFATPDRLWRHFLNNIGTG
jgi:hypothetical protein